MHCKRFIWSVNPLE